MIPIHKLEKLPVSQRLRKILKIFSEAEYRISQGCVLPEPERIFLLGAGTLLFQTDRFSGPAREALEGALGNLAPRRDLLRGVNSIRHLLLAELGKQTADWDFIDHRRHLDSEKRRIFPGMTIFLEEIRSPYNVGALFRAAESFGAERIFLSPLCASPLHPRSSRTAMGCVSLIPWEHRTLETLEGPCFALETGGISLGNFAFPSQGLLIVGSEELGVSPGALGRADCSLGRVSIPAWGVKGSLNVSVAFGIVIHAWAQSLYKGR
jgi:TrmH family RNA methyltransferase